MPPLAVMVSTILAGGAGVWQDYTRVIRNVSDPIATPHNFTPGAVAFQLGMSHPGAALLQLASSAAVVAMILVAALRAESAASYLATVVASQLLSPVLWDHYAMLLLLPVAYLVQRGHWWSILIPLSASVLALGLTPPILYPLAFWVSLVAVVVVGRRESGVAPQPLAAQT